jgi:dihydrofolate reductase
MKLNMIVAYCENRGIGINNQLPWYFKSDLKKFKKLTVGNKNNAVIMGSNTWKSIGKSLPNRDNLILSKSLSKDVEEKNVYIFDTLEGLEKFYKSKKYDDIWIIGGSEIYKIFMEKNIDNIYITYINKTYNCDIFFPEIDNNKYILSSKSIHNDLIIDPIINNNDILFDIVYKLRDNYTS